MKAERCCPQTRGLQGAQVPSYSGSFFSLSAASSSLLLEGSRTLTWHAEALLYVGHNRGRIRALIVFNGSEHKKSSYSALTIWISLFGILYFLMMIQRLSRLCTECNAFSKPTKLIYIVAFHSLAFPRVFLRMNVWSTVHLPLGKPSCSFLCVRSTPACILFMMIRLRKLLTRSSKVTHLQLLHSCKLPFWEIWRISLLIHSLGTFSSFHIWWIWVFGWSGLSLISTFLQLSDLLQGLFSFWAPSMQLFLLVLRVSRQKYLASFSVLCSCSSWGGDSEISLFSTFLKCSFHLANLPSLLFNSSPSLLFTAAFFFFPFPVNCFTIFLLSPVYSCFLYSLGFLRYPPPLIHSYFFLTALSFSI